jgi:hypothetical protein
MKKYLVLLIALGIHFSVYSQEIPMPDFAKRPFIVGAENTLVDFERLVAVVDIKIKGMGYGGSEIFYTVTPSRSQVRFPLSNMPKFVIKTESNQDPSEVVYLSKVFESNSKRRRFLATKMSMLGKSKEVDNQFIQIDFKKLGENFYQIIIVDPIGNGEYAFIPFDTGVGSKNMMGKVFVNCFGID